MDVCQGIRRAVQTNGNGIATIDGERSHTWAEFADRISRLAGALRRIGFEDGDRVAILAHNSDRYLECYFGVPYAGGVIVPLNTRLASAELIYSLNDSGAKVLIVDDELQSHLPAFDGKLETVEHIVFAGDGCPAAEMMSYDDLVKSAEPVASTSGCDDDTVGIFYTGGTTGLPKGVMLTHANIVSNGLHFASAVSLSEPWTYLHAAPMFHLADCTPNYAVTASGSTHAFVRKFDVETVLSAITLYRVTHTVLVPTMINMLANSQTVANHDLESMQKILYGGSPMPEAVIAKAKDAFPNCELMQGYGMTEAAPLITILEHKYHTFEGPNAGRSTSAGRAMLGVEVKVVDAKGNEAPRGTIGEIAARGPNVMKGYWNKPQETAVALRDGWLHTGDAGYIDDDGFVFIVDRIKDMVITGGENVYSVEVENCIYQHPAIATCAVIGIPSREWGESIHAIVTCKAGRSTTQSEIIAHCKERIASYKCPRSVEIRSEPLPLSGAGKILKTELRAAFWQESSRSVS